MAVPAESAPIALGMGGATIDVVTYHGSDWFPIRFNQSDTRSSLVFYMRRDELRALRDRLNVIDNSLPEPSATQPQPGQMRDGELPEYVEFNGQPKDDFR